jgi:hypothetical protein
LYSGVDFGFGSRRRSNHVGSARTSVCQAEASLMLCWILAIVATCSVVSMFISLAVSMRLAGKLERAEKKLEDRQKFHIEAWVSPGDAPHLWQVT